MRFDALLNVQALLDQAAPLSELVTSQDVRAIRTACACLLRVRAEAQTNVTARTVAGQQLQVMNQYASNRSSASSQTAHLGRSLLVPGTSSVNDDVTNNDSRICHASSTEDPT